MKLTQIKKSTAKHAIIFGPPKSGKTLLVGALSEHFNLKWIDLENGRNTLFSLPVEWQERIDIIAIPDSKDFPIAAETVPLILKGGKTRICNTHGKVSCALCMKSDPADFSEICLNEMTDNDILVLDSATQLSNSIMSHIGRGKDDLWKPEWEHYRTQGAMLDRFYSSLQNAPFHCAIITHEAAIKMEDDREKLVPVSGTVNFSRNTAKYFDEVVYCEVKNRRHVSASSTLYAPNVLTGSRTGKEIERGSASSLLPIFLGSEVQEKPAVAMLKDVQRTVQEMKK